LESVTFFIACAQPGKMTRREVEASLDALVLRAPARGGLTSFSLQRGQSLDLRITFGDPQMALVLDNDG